MWARREALNARLPDPETAVREAAAHPARPVSLMDCGDNIGGGGPGDSTILLAEILRQGVRDCLVVLYDPQAVQACVAAGVRNPVRLDVGAKTDDRHGQPLELTGTVRTITDGSYVNRGPMFTGMSVNMGRTAVFVVDDVEVILTERRVQPFDMEALRSVGIEPTERLIIGLKSAVHFRADYGPIARAIYDLDTPGVHNPDVTLYDYRRLRRPMWPLDGDQGLGVGH